MATLQQKIMAEHRMRELLRSEGMPEPDAVEYGYTCIRFFFEETKTCLVIDIDPDRDDGKRGSDGGGLWSEPRDSAHGGSERRRP